MKKQNNIFGKIFKEADYSYLFDDNNDITWYEYNGYCEFNQFNKIHTFDDEEYDDFFNDY